MNRYGEVVPLKRIGKDDTRLIVQECDATMMQGSTEAGYIKISCKKKRVM
jgi:hypothetical protein